MLTWYRWPPRRSRTLLHFVAREVAKQHPDGACLKAALPSAAAAAQLDMAGLAAQLTALSTEARWAPPAGSSLLWAAGLHAPCLACIAFN